MLRWAVAVLMMVVGVSGSEAAGQATESADALRPFARRAEAYDLFMQSLRLEDTGDVARAIELLDRAAVLDPAAAAIPFWLRRDPNRQLLVSIVLFWTLFHIAFLGEPRYHIPLYPVFAISASAGIWAALTSASAWLASRRAKRAPITSDTDARTEPVADGHPLRGKV